MNNNTHTKDKGAVWTNVGLVAMAVLTLTQFVPSLQLAGYSVLVGIAFFFIVEAVSKTPTDRSGLRFKTFFSDLKKPGVLLLMLLPIATALIPLFVGDLIFDGGYSAHVTSRTSPMLSFDSIPLLVVQVIVFALGEEIAWRGFAVGKSMQRYPFVLCAVVSSALFALGHLAEGSFWLVLFDVALIFIDSLIYAVIYKKTGNCLMSTIAHILCNAVALLAVSCLH